MGQVIFRHAFPFLFLSLSLRPKFYLLPPKQTGPISCLLSCQRRNKCSRFHSRSLLKALRDTQTSAFNEVTNFTEVIRPFKIAMLPMKLKIKFQPDHGNLHKIGGGSKIGRQILLVHVKSSGQWSHVPKYWIKVVTCSQILD